MKRQIRRSVFETNSSSTHAICITKEDVDISNLPNHVTFTHGEFGWENDEYSDLYSKASYLYQAICDCYFDDKAGKEEVIDKITKMLCDYGISCDFEPDMDKEYGDGYIDHGNETIDFVKAVLEDSDRLLRYLFGNSFVVTGNDNGYGYSDRMYVFEGDEVTKWGTFPRHGGLKPEFDSYEIYEKGN
jgi:hypothetical protein